jgi:hypothetical protein
VNQFYLTDSYPDEGVCVKKQKNDGNCTSHLSCFTDKGLQCTDNGCQCRDVNQTFNDFLNTCSMPTCPDNWIQNCSKCIQVFNTQLSWAAAKAQCETFSPNGRLLTIESRALFEFITNKINPNNDYWVTLFFGKKIFLKLKIKINVKLKGWFKFNWTIFELSLDAQC